jgi:hypothetical protein
VIPAYGFFIRHVKGIEFSNVEVSYMKEDLRPAFVLSDVSGADFFNVKAQLTSNNPFFALKNVSDFNAYKCKGVPDTKIDRVEQKTF